MPDRTTDTASASRARGRPREFDMEQALDRAVDVFSQRGYHGTSIGDLARGTELAQGSLYKAFRTSTRCSWQRWTTTARAASKAWREPSALAAPGANDCAGCWPSTPNRRKAGRAGRAAWWSSAAELSFFDEDVAERVTTALGRNEALLAGLIREGQEDGSLAVHIDPADAARMLLCLVQGMRVVGKTGRRRQDMLAVVDMALKALE